MHLPHIFGYFSMLDEVRTEISCSQSKVAQIPTSENRWFHVNIWAVINTMGALSIYPKDAFVCPLKNGISPLQSYNLGMGLRPPILL